MTDLETHERRLSNPDGYRPSSCPRCGHGVLHVHDYPSRTLRGDPKAGIRVVRHRCVGPGCGACWRILPMLLARHLWRRWQVVEPICLPPVCRGTGRRPGQAPRGRRPAPVPERTARRWRARLRTDGRVLTRVLAASGKATLERVAKGVGLAATRLDVVLALGLTLTSAAALLHRLAPGLRLM